MAELRTKTKSISFGIIYGIGVKKLADNLGISLDEAKDLLKRYFFTFPRIKEAIKRLLAVPRSAPRINGIAFFKLINRIAAKGTNRPIVMLEENKIAVNITPRKYDLYFELK